MSFVIIECTLMRVSNTVILEVFKGYDENSRASRSNTTYRVSASEVRRESFFDEFEFHTLRIWMRLIEPSV